MRKSSQGFKWTGEVRLIEKDLGVPLRWKKPRRIFVNSMSDLFHEHVPDEWIDRIFDVMIQAPHVFQILTKRPARMQKYVTRWLSPALTPQMLENIWLGVSVENQATADARIPYLQQTPGIVRFVSYEPALGPVDFERGGFSFLRTLRSPHGTTWPGINWLIVGGESGPQAREFDLTWARQAVQQCAMNAVPVWVKQMGSNPIDPLSVTWPGATRFKDRKGADPEEWPDNLRVQQMPATL